MFCEHHGVFDGEGKQKTWLITSSNQTFPFHSCINWCSFFLFDNIVIVVKQPHVDFGMKVLGADIMSIPGLYRFVQVPIFLHSKIGCCECECLQFFNFSVLLLQETIKKQVAILYLWPQTLQIPVLDPSMHVYHPIYNTTSSILSFL